MPPKTRAPKTDTTGASKKEILELAAKNNVRFLRLQFTDILGATDGVAFAALALVSDSGKRGSGLVAVARSGDTIASIAAFDYDGGRIAGALLNDIGPALETRGLDNIRAYVGKPQNWPTWLHAARFRRKAF